MVEECGKASRLLEDMLTLARANAGNAHIAFEPVDLAEVLRIDPHSRRRFKRDCSVRNLERQIVCQIEPSFVAR